jgi:pimeloyl-ACP methyl ester carboxylesterase
MAVKKPGYYSYSDDETLNFMLNRLAWHINHERLVKIGKKVSSLEHFVSVMLKEAEEDEQKGLLLEAGYLYRGAEFFMTQEHPRKKEVYDKFMHYFYKYTDLAQRRRKEVPYVGGKLGTIDIPAEGVERDVLVFCSGFDGLIEELYDIALSFSKNGYRVVLYEGPGQGSALRWSGLTMTHEWERPTKVILDYYKIKRCTLIGLSLGGYLAPRAAAFDSRIKRVVSWGSMQKFAECSKKAMGERKGTLIFRFIKMGFRSLINAMVKKAASQDMGTEWGLSHGLHTSGQKDAFDFFKWLLNFDLEPVAHLIEQDALLIQGTHDHLVDVEQLYQQFRSLVNARSVTTRLATEKEEAAQHCQIGHPQLVIDEILLLMEGLDRRNILLDC